ncbi:divalent-cation tolerance protein CutA [Microbispora bryophytorum]|uniref:divalent-cation tolerance protein CutA n=1 Tax=Microbispora bryophytorum TaxID=1460882 RepID=UPI0033D47304
MSDYIEIRVTTSHADQASKICSAVVTKRLAACAQVIGPITSTYWWAGEVRQAEEWLVLMKTTADRFEDLATCVRELHSYEVPEIVAVPIVLGTPDYLEWIRRETAPERDE